MTSRSKKKPKKGQDLPRYAQVENDLIERISTGQYAVGSLLPKEIILAEQYGISRHTMREALRRLRDAGLVRPRRRAGTVVVSRAPALSYQQPINSIRDLVQYGEDTEMRVQSMRWVTCDASLATMLECKKGQKWLRVETIRMSRVDIRPICMTTLYLRATLRRVESELRRLARPVSAIIESVYGPTINEVEQRIQAISLDAKSAKILGAPAGSAALKAIRRFYDSTRQLLEYVIAIHPGDRFTYLTRVKRK
jgi:GntR family transcriptional regulator